MSTEISTTQSFQEKMYERIKESMGDLLSKEDLAKLVEAGIQKAFFQERKDYERTNSYHTYHKPPLIAELVESLLKEKIAEIANEHVAKNPDIFENAMREQINKGMAGAFMHYLDAQTITSRNQMFQELQRALGRP